MVQFFCVKNSTKNEYFKINRIYYIKVGKTILEKRKTYNGRDLYKS